MIRFRASENHAVRVSEGEGAVTAQRPQRSGGPRVSAVDGADE
jgi:hypothetical protein